MSLTRVETQSANKLKATNLRKFMLLHEGTQGIRIAFKWLSHAPSFRGDFYEYIWQRQNQRPPCERLIFSTSDADGHRSRNVFITNNSMSESEPGKRCAEILFGFNKHFAEVLPPGDQSFCQMDNAYLGAVFAVLMVLAGDTMQYVNSISRNITNLVS